MMSASLTCHDNSRFFRCFLLKILSVYLLFSSFPSPGDLHPNMNLDRDALVVFMYTCTCIYLLLGCINKEMLCFIHEIVCVYLYNPCNYM